MRKRSNWPMLSPMHKSLFSSCHSFQGCDDRWDMLRTTGADDDTLIKHIANEYGLGGGASGIDGEYREHSAKGGADPAFWYDTAWMTSGPPTLRGQALINAVRNVLEIPILGTHQATMF